MLEKLQLEEIEPTNISNRIRNALEYLYEESLNESKLEIANTLKEALEYHDEIMRIFPEHLYAKNDSILTFYFIIAVLGLNSEKLNPLIEFLKWMSVIPNANKGREVA